VKEYDYFYKTYEEDLEHVHSKCEEYKALPRTEIDITKNKVRIKNFDFFEEGKAEVIKSEPSEIITFPENIPVVAQKKELGFLVENLEKRMLHIPGFAKTETANECMQETVSSLDQFCEKNLDFMGNVLYKTEYTPLREIRMKFSVEDTDIPSTRHSVSRFKGDHREQADKEIHNIWKDSIEKQRERQSRGERDELTEQELQRRQEMLNSMKEFDEQVKDYQKKMEQQNQKEAEEIMEKSSSHTPHPESDFKINPITEDSRKKLVQENLISEKKTVQANKEQEGIIEPTEGVGLTEEQRMIMEQNKAKQELFLKKQAELKYNEGKSTYEKMSVYSMKEEHLTGKGPVDKDQLAKQNADKLKLLIKDPKNQKLETLLDKGQFDTGSPQEGTPKVDIDAIMKSQKLKEQKEALANKVLGINFKRSNISIDKIVKGKKLNGLSQSGEKLFFFGDEFIFKCSLSFQDPVMYKIGGKELTFMRSVQQEIGPDHYLLGITNKQRDTSEVLLIRLTNQFSLSKRICVEEKEASGIISIFNLTGKKQFIVVTRFGEVHLYDYSQPMIHLLSKETLNGERIETAILTAKETSICLVSQNSQIIGFEIKINPETQLAVGLSKTRILPLDNQANDIVKVSEDQVGYCDEEGKFSLLTLPMELNGNKLGIKKTSVCDFPVDRLFILESTQNQEMDFRRDILSILMLNYEGHVAVFDFRNRKSQAHFDPKLVEDICLHSQNAILSQRNQGKFDVLILSTKTLKKLIIDKTPSSK
jgi:hypothetical protein